MEYSLKLRGLCLDGDVVGLLSLCTGWTGARHFLTMMLFLGMANAYVMRTNMSVAIVAMVNQTALPRKEEAVDDECGTSNSTTVSTDIRAPPRPAPPHPRNYYGVSMFLFSWIPSEAVVLGLAKTCACGLIYIRLALKAAYLPCRRIGDPSFLAGRG